MYLQIQFTYLQKCQGKIREMNQVKKKANISGQDKQNAIISNCLETKAGYFIYVFKFMINTDFRMKM